MSSPIKPVTRLQAVLIAIAFLAGAAWLFHNGMTIMRTGRPIYRMYAKHRHYMYELECFLYSAGMAALGVWLLGWAAGLVKGRQDPP